MIDRTDPTLSWKDAVISLSIAFGIALAVAAGAAYHFNHQFGHMVGGGFGTIGEIASKLIS